MKYLFYSFLTFACIALLNISSANAQQVNAKIQEVLGDKTEEILASDPARLAFYNDVIEKRTQVMEMPFHEKEVYIKLSTVPLLNKYNPNLSRDVVFDPLNFNPLKYSFSFSSNKTEIYRVDNTDYLIIIKPQTFK